MSSEQLQKWLDKNKEKWEYFKSEDQEKSYICNSFSSKINE